MNVSEDDARVYKHVIYYKVKEAHPELKNLDRAIEVEKETTKENLESIDLKKSKKNMKKLGK